MTLNRILIRLDRNADRRLRGARLTWIKVRSATGYKVVSG
jgi:hypothetical protein